jgi:hypothetical protein
MGGGAPGNWQLEQRLESADRGAKESSMKCESAKSENFMRQTGNPAVHPEVQTIIQLYDGATRVV